MNLNEIRKMSDEQLKQFMNTLSQRKNLFCAKCGNVIVTQEKMTINIGKYNKHYGQEIKKLCSLCKNCYSDLLDYLAVADIDWNK